MGGTCAALTFLYLILDPGGGALAREVLGRARAAAAAARSEFESPARAEPT